MYGPYVGSLPEIIEGEPISEMGWGLIVVPKLNKVIWGQIFGLLTK